MRLNKKILISSSNQPIIHNIIFFEIIKDLRTIPNCILSLSELSTFYTELTCNDLLQNHCSTCCWKYIYRASNLTDKPPFHLRHWSLFSSYFPNLCSCNSATCLNQNLQKNVPKARMIFWTLLVTTTTVLKLAILIGCLTTNSVKFSRGKNWTSGGPPRPWTCSAPCPCPASPRRTPAVSPPPRPRRPGPASTPWWPACRHPSTRIR